MKACISLAALAAGLALCAAARAQPAAADVEARSHILSAFMSGADPLVLGEGVVVGPALRARLGPQTSNTRLYNSLIELSLDKPLTLRRATSDEISRFARGRPGGDPVYVLEAGEDALLLQYAAQDKRLAYVEDLKVVAAMSAAGEPLKPAAPMPRTRCNIKAAMSDEDLRNCADIAGARIVAVEMPAPPVLQSSAGAPQSRAPCVVKAQMSAQDLRNCGVSR
jgi:hypothetical protein